MSLYGSEALRLHLLLVGCFLVLNCSRQSHAIELTFELPDSEKICFYEVIERNVSCILEYQVITGGNYDVDIELKSLADGKILSKETKKQFDSVTFMTEVAGEYELCFSNEFSTFTHKVIYFDLVVGEDDPLRSALGNHITAMTLMEAAAEGIHDSLSTVVDHQTHHRLRESQGKAFADVLNDHVQLWSMAQALIILCVGFGQVLVLRSFFNSGPTIDRRYTGGNKNNARLLASS